MSLERITVFTPTYNRKTLLESCYYSLKRQTNKSFVWLIIDDGSQDGTDAVVREWIKETSEFRIEYVYKENGGLHTAYNTAIDLIETELAMCVDSDDYLKDNAIETILKKWFSEDTSNVAGIVALNEISEQEILGTALPELKEAHLIDLVCKYKCRRDLKMIYKTQVLKAEGPIPVFESEKHMNPYYLFLKIDKKLPMLLLNRAVCVVNYQRDGMSQSIIQQYVESPRSFAELRSMMISMERASNLYVFKNTAHLISSSLILRDFSLMSKNGDKWIKLLAFIPGVALYFTTEILYWIGYKKLG